MNSFILHCIKKSFIYWY